MVLGAVRPSWLAFPPVPGAAATPHPSGTVGTEASGAHPRSGTYHHTEVHLPNT